MQAANKRYKEIIETYEVPELPADVDKNLQKFIEKIS
jgi:trimethylamine:corrinoid methyltransferase-like protein